MSSRPSRVFRTTWKPIRSPGESFTTPRIRTKRIFREIGTNCGNSDFYFPFFQLFVFLPLSRILTKSIFPLKQESVFIFFFTMRPITFKNHKCTAEVVLPLKSVKRLWLRCCKLILIRGIPSSETFLWSKQILKELSKFCLICFKTN